MGGGSRERTWENEAKTEVETETGRERTIPHDVGRDAEGKKENMEAEADEKRTVGGKCVHASQGKETHKNMASAEVIWGCVRNNSAFLKKGGNGAQFAAEPGNLTHRNSFKCSGETNGSNATENRTKGWMDADRSDPKNPWERDADGRTKTTTDATSTARTIET